ncbi:hypothetical protein DH09_00085 (plasmid) [Bacillaceae bacterium JMAK1]|nr:hypothetical protein DH09_00085 [Bacillaceae bacterium JMAK1]
MFKKNHLVVLCTILLLSACNESSDSDAQTSTWPDEEITMVVPFPTGGTADRQARALASAMGEDLGVRILVDNREGGASAIGATSHFQQDSNDGTYFIYNSHPHFEATILRGASYEFEDFDYMGIIHESPIAIWVPSDSEYQTLEDLLLDIEQNPNALSYSMISSSWSDTSIKILTNELGLEVRDIPYDGGAEIRTALLGGEVDFMASDVEGTIAGGGDDLRALAVFSDEPYEQRPEIPLINEELDEMGITSEMPVISNRRFAQVKASFREEYPERYEILAEAVESAAKSEEFNEWGETQDMYFTWITEEDTHVLLEETFQLMNEYRNLFE